MTPDKETGAAPKKVYSGVTSRAHKLGMASSRPIHPQACLSVGSLVLDAGARTLTGPAGTCDLRVGALAVLRALMRQPGQVVEIGRLIEARWCSNLEPASAQTAIRMALSRARDAIAHVGGDPKQLRAASGVGYKLIGEAKVVRSFTLEQAALLDQLLASHPDATRVAALVEPGTA